MLIQLIHRSTSACVIYYLLKGCVQNQMIINEINDNILLIVQDRDIVAMED